MCSKKELDLITNTISIESKNLFQDKLDRVILYGSYARGDNSKYSDVDLMIIVDEDPILLCNYRNKIAHVASDLSFLTEDCIVVSATLQDRENFEKFKYDLPYFMNVEKEGIVLYDKRKPEGNSKITV